MALYYRVCSFGKPLAPWRPTQRLARLDAVELGVGEFDEWGKFYLSAGSELAWVHENEIRKRALADRYPSGCRNTRDPAPTPALRQA